LEAGQFQNQKYYGRREAGGQPRYLILKNGKGGFTNTFCYLSTGLNAIHEAADTRPEVGMFTELLDKFE
jgi:hypothetical protein